MYKFAGSGKIKNEVDGDDANRPNEKLTRRKGLVFVKKMLRTAAVLLAVLLGSGAVLPSSAAAGKAAVSPALAQIAAKHEMVKAGLQYGAISFSADDFARALNRSKISSITIETLPPAAEGCLKLGNATVSAGQTIARSGMGMLRFVPASASVVESGFSFTCEESGYAIRCALYLLPEVNYAPTVALAGESSLAVSTHKSVSCFGTLSAYDPEGDPLVYEIVTQPKKGSVTLLDASCGDYRYTPAAGKSGRDSFRYVVRDKYGNYSAAATVSIRIEPQKTSVVYADMDGHWAQNAALTMTEAGIMQGYTAGASTYFAPAETVSRGEFLVMAMNAAGISSVPAVADSGFADDAEIPASMKGYVAAAAELGYIKGRLVDGRQVFCPMETITRAEAAVMLGRMLNAAAPTVKPVFADADSVPAWAYDALSALNALGIFKGEGGGQISAGSLITRAQAAQIFCSVMELK